MRVYLDICILCIYIKTGYTKSAKRIFKIKRRNLNIIYIGPVKLHLYICIDIYLHFQQINKLSHSGITVWSLENNNLIELQSKNIRKSLKITNYQFCT